MAATEKRKKTSGFAIGLLVYGVVLLVVVAVGLMFFYLFIDAYEQTRPATVAQAYLDSLTADRVIEREPVFFSYTLDNRLQSEGEARAFVQTLLREDLHFARDYSSQEEGYSYVLESGETPIGRFTLTETGETQLGFACLAVSQESFDLTPYVRQVEITVPTDYKVECNGIDLAWRYVEKSRVPYDLLNEFYDDGYKLPWLVTYQTGKVLGEPELLVTDGEGNPVTGEALSEDAFTDNCSIAEKEEIWEFVYEYITRYVRYLSGTQLVAMAGYSQVASMVVEGSDLQQRLLSAVGGLGFASSKSDEIQSIEINRMMNVGNGYYVCDVTYLVKTLGQADYVTTTNNSKLVMVETDYGLRATSQASY